MNRLMRLFRVRADRRTGAWLEPPEEVGAVRAAEHYAKRDTDDEHYDVFEVDDETCAVVVHWVD
jgi:hypothetical protein